jgi:hypothetical protein
MQPIVKQTLLMTVCLLGMLTGMVHPRESTGIYAAVRDRTDFHHIESDKPNPEVAAIDQERDAINRLSLQQTDFNRNVDGYEYTVTIYQDTDQHIRKVIFSKFSRLGSYLLDLEEYYDLRGVLIYLEYGELEHEKKPSGHTEIHGKMYFRSGTQIRNLSYEITGTGKRAILANNQLQPEEFHPDVQSLQRALQAPITP